MDYSQISKNFNIKIPYKDNGQYYIDLLSLSKEYANLKSDIEELSNTIVENRSELRLLAIEKLKELFEPRFNWENDKYKSDLQEKEFKPENNNTYLSIDVKEANWTISNYILTSEKRSWYDYVIDEFNFPPYLAKSKGLRQDIMGNVVNPRKFTTLQKFITYQNLQKVLSYVSIDKIASINAEEIIINVGDDIDLINNIKSIDYQVKTRITLFRTDIITNYGDKVIVKDFFDYKSLWKVDGHRFYIHFKTLIVGGELSEYDKIFRHENKYFEFCGKDYKDFREHRYIENNYKKLNMVKTHDKMYTFYLDKEPLYVYNTDNKNHFMVLNGVKEVKLKHENNWEKQIIKYHISFIKSFLTK